MKVIRQEKYNRIVNMQANTNIFPLVFYFEVHITIIHTSVKLIILLSTKSKKYRKIVDLEL